MSQANLIEIFSSWQGEGPYVGERMLFVRFQNCALSCKFCDTPASFEKLPQFRWEKPGQSRDFLEGNNPLTSQELKDLVQAYSDDTLSLTGGEPLQHAEFLRDWLPSLDRKYKILLETNGVLPAALKSVIDWIDIVSMDMKLPSVTGMRSYWEEHEAFLRIAKQKEVYVKVVVSSPTSQDELNRALEIVERVAPEIPFILQPVTPAWQVKEGIPETRLKEFYDHSVSRLPNVRVIPQVHALLNIL